MHPVESVPPRKLVPSQAITRRAERPIVGRALSLVVISDRAVTSHALPPTGQVVIGRSEEADIVIDDPSVSRRHATLLVGPTLELDDLDSANGTSVRDRPLTRGERVTIRVGEAIQIGLVTAVVQPRSQAAPRLHDHAYFAARLDEECGRAAGRPNGGVVVCVRTEQAGAGDALARLGVVATYTAGTFELLLTEVAGELDAAAIIAQVRAALGPAAGDAEIGVARLGVDGDTADALLSAATAAARGEGRYQLGALHVVVKSPVMQRIYRLTERIAASELSVLILGETGVGKEILAEAVHRMSPRAARPFLRLNCAALTETLLESELFGHERGSFTGADRAKVGLLESAQGGTVFLDEIGEMPASTQVKLLRVIEERQVLPVGAVRSRPIDLRFVAATNRDLEADATRGVFRQDLFFRLNGFSLVLPPLRERVEEIALLAASFAARAARAGGLPPPVIAGEAVAWLEAQPWPGNIRELRNAIERAVVLAHGAAIRIEHLATEPAPRRRVETGPIAATSAIPANPAIPRATVSAEDTGAMRDALAAAERRRILAVLDDCAGNQTQAALKLGISRRTLLKRLDAYAVPRPRKGRDE